VLGPRDSSDLLLSLEFQGSAKDRAQVKLAPSSISKASTSSATTATGEVHQFPLCIALLLAAQVADYSFRFLLICLLVAEEFLPRFQPQREFLFQPAHLLKLANFLDYFADFMLSTYLQRNKKNLRYFYASSKIVQIKTYLKILLIMSVLSLASVFKSIELFFC